jgi:transmembrane sensor
MNYQSAITFSEKFATGNYSAAEHAEFAAWLKTAPEAEYSGLLETFREIAAALPPATTADPVLVARIEAALNRHEAGQRGYVLRRFLQFSAAAAILLLLAGAGWWVMRKEKSSGIAATFPSQAPKNDILPGGDKAVLTLADGSRIVLDSARNGQLARQGGAQVIKINGQVSYQGAGNEASPAYNTIATPRGGQYQIILSDGTVAWLNSASSLRFPAAFHGAAREVQLTGEGYFEVAKDKDRPFRVITGDMAVAVLGTSFNIMAYPEETAIRTTLVAGSVRVERGNARTLLVPGKQAVLLPGAGSFETVEPDMESTLAWKNGRFEFDETDIRTIMRQVERWYAVKVEYQGDVSSVVLSGEVSRRKTASALLDVLAKTGQFHYRIEDDRILIMR